MNEKTPLHETHAFILRHSKEEKFLENVDEVSVQRDEFRMIHIFHGQKTLKANVKDHHNIKGRIPLIAVAQ